MRSDMDKVVTERPRYGHANRSKKTRLKINSERAEGRYGYDELPKRVPVSKNRQYGWGSKEFSDLIGPLKRFLRSKVGCHWDKVYSELSQVLDKRSLTGRHIWIHVWMEVEKDCTVGQDGKIYPNPKFGRHLPLGGTLYIHPKTGVLCWAK